MHYQTIFKQNYEPLTFHAVVTAERERKIIITFKTYFYYHKDN